MTLLAAVYAFFQEHERCGDLDSGVLGDDSGALARCSAVRPSRSCHVSVVSLIPGSV
jgi:hypothetical protein